MPPDDSPLAGRFVLLDQIGAGAMGSVCRAWDLREQRFVAVKQLRQVDAPGLVRFVRELSTRIDHPHVATPRAWAADDDRVAYAMELAAGGSLRDLLHERSSLPADFVRTVLAQLHAGLSAVHAAGIVHRDLKPANLLLHATRTSRPHLLIADFGVAATIGESGRLAVGTPGFAPSAQLAGEPADPAHDLIAVDVLSRLLHERVRPDAEPVDVRDRFGPSAIPVPGALRPAPTGRRSGSRRRGSGRRRGTSRRSLPGSTPGA
ncbi:MAG: serine/threonine-protein kinase [Nocardioides sp.]